MGACCADLAGDWRTDHRRARAPPGTRAEPDRPDPDRADWRGRVIPGRAGIPVRNRVALPLLATSRFRPRRDLRGDHRGCDRPPSPGETIAHRIPNRFRPARERTRSAPGPWLATQHGVGY